MLAKQLLMVMLLYLALPMGFPASSLDARPAGPDSSKAAFKELLLSTVIAEAYLAPYTFIWGVTLGGSAITQDEGPERATATWIGISLAGLGLGWFMTDQIAKEYVTILRTASQRAEPGSWRFYRLVGAGVSTASIIDFEAESIYTGEQSSPQWTAGTAEVNTATTFPALGYRIGGSGGRWGGEFEASLVSHHTKEQTVTYDAEGYVVVPGIGRVPIEIGSVDIPDRFLMLHSLSMGATFYAWLPKVIVRPYVGLGGRLLLNSVQSQYPGPANLTLEEGSLALDSMTLGWGLHALFGVRAPLADKKFLYAEFRPARHYFAYESGSGFLQERDNFTLQIFEFQLGLGFYLN
ncbi:MAG: hypothetical protein IH971_10620 [Candidatus Marinimicrobia bacterium]|nr:hypothetical protein [Candidatus Neomarinimicrobiota bacterium]